MSIKPPFTAVEVRRAASGFYQGHSVEIALLSKGIMVALVIWALVWPANANSNLSSLNWWLSGGLQRILYHHCRYVRLFPGRGGHSAENRQA